MEGILGLMLHYLLVILIINTNSFEILLTNLLHGLQVIVAVV